MKNSIFLFALMALFLGCDSEEYEYTEKCSEEKYQDFLDHLDSKHSPKTQEEFELCKSSCTSLPCEANCKADYHRSSEYESTMIAYGPCLEVGEGRGHYFDWKAYAHCSSLEVECHEHGGDPEVCLSLNEECTSFVLENHVLIDFEAFK